VSTTNSYSGSTTIGGKLSCTYTGDKQGNENAPLALLANWNPAGGADPQLSGFLWGTVAVAGATDFLLAAAVAALGELSSGLVPSGLKIKEVCIQNLDLTHAVTITQKLAGGYPLFGAAGSGQIIAHGGTFYWYDPLGGAIGTITTASNDGITVTPASGTVSLYVRIAFGP